MLARLGGDRGATEIPLPAFDQVTPAAPVTVPPDTAHGAVLAHLQNTATDDFQPANVTWTWFSALPGKKIREKRERRAALATRALQRIDVFAATVAPTVTPSAVEGQPPSLEFATGR